MTEEQYTVVPNAFSGIVNISIIIGGVYKNEEGKQRDVVDGVDKESYVISIPAESLTEAHLYITDAFKKIKTEMFECLPLARIEEKKG